MKHLTLLLLLLCPVLFYGQKGKVYEGFIGKLDSSYYFYTKTQPVELLGLKFTSKNVFNIEENLMWVKVKGKREKGTIFVTKVLKSNPEYTYHKYQSEIHKEGIYTEPAEVEGFYKYEKDNSAFYEIYEGRVLQPVWLNLRDNKIALPENFSNTALIKIKGVRRRGTRMGYATDYYYNEEIIVTKIKAVDNSKKLEDYLKEQSNKKPVVNKPYESEGFLMFTNYDTIFYPKKGNVLYPGTDVIFKTKLSNRQKAIYDNYDKERPYSREYPLVKIKGYYTDRKDYELYDKVIISEIVSTDTLVKDWDFRKNNRNRKIENIEYFEEEGFFSKGFEHSAFTILRGDSLVGGSGWVHFDESVTAIDSLHEITARKSPDMRRGIYMKAKGIKRFGGEYGYGHFGGGSYELIVSKIEAIDTSRTRWEFAIDRIDKTGYFGVEKVTYPNILREGKEYLFEGVAHAYLDSTMVDKDTIYDIKINLTRKGGYLHYRYIVSYEGKVLEDVTSKNIMNVFLFLRDNRDDEYESELYEALSPHMRWHNDISLFTIRIYNRHDDDGRIVIEIDDNGLGSTLYSKTD